MAIALRYAARSDLGLIRDGNEDSGYAGPRLLVVADGVGGHAAGEVASTMAVRILANLDEDSPGHDLLDALAGAVHQANDYLRDMVEGDPGLEGMSTTLTALLRAGSRFGLVHVGDSRGYLLRDGGLQQITHDHTFVQTLVDEGRITAEEADHHPQRNLITNALDGRGDIELDLSVREAREGDRYLLCSDGLSGVVSEATIHKTLSAADGPEQAVGQLVELALRGGGPDNITAIVADVVDVDAAPPAVPVVVGAAAEGTARRTTNDSAAGKAAALSPSPTDDEEELEEVDAPRRSWVKRILLGALLLGLLGAAGYAAWDWSRQQYYVAADGANVAIYRGLTQDVGPIKTSELYETEAVPLADLPDYHRERVQSEIPAANLADAHRIVRMLAEQARRCREQAAASPTPTPTPTPATTTPATTPSARASGSASPSPGAGSAGTATPSPTPTPSPSASQPELLECGDAS